MKPPVIKEKVILGIDPGTTIMGYGVLKVTAGKASMVTMGVIDLRKYTNHYLKLGRIFERVTGIIEAYLPDELAIEAPFFGKNVQSMLKLGRAQGVAMAAAIHRDIPITEYAPMKIKMALTGNGEASKEQVADMLKRILKIPDESMLPFLDATDGLAAAYCHYLQSSSPLADKGCRSWKEFIAKNPGKVNTLSRRASAKATEASPKSSEVSPKPAPAAKAPLVSTGESLKECSGESGEGTAPEKS